MGWVADVVAALGPVGVGLLVALENVFPPMPSEIILPFAGFVSGRGGAPVWIMILAATAGSVGGGLILYELGRRLGQERVEGFLCRLPLVNAEDVRHATGWFHRHGQAAVFTGRFMPFVRSVVSLPAGAEPMPRGRFVLLTTVGSAIWNALWVYGGYLLGTSWKDAGRYSDWLNIAFGVIAAGLVARFVWSRRDRLGSHSDA